MTRSHQSTRAFGRNSVDTSLSAKKAQSLKLDGKEVGPSPPRRVTRSQSREVESGVGLQNNPLNANANAPARAGGKKQRGKAKALDVIEESPVNTPHQSNVQLQKPQEDPFNTSNISGTTFAGTESDHESGDLDPVMMAEVLPELQRAATGVLDFLIPRGAQPARIIENARKLRDPKNTQSRRLTRHRVNLSSEAKYFGPEPYVDVNSVRNLLLSAANLQSAEDRKRWAPDPILHSVNCARFAAEVLLAGSGTTSPRDAIDSLEGTFPSPFMNALVGDTSTSHDTVGISALDKATFDLAVDIRTQFLRMELEERQHDPDFDPEAIVRVVFYVELPVHEAKANPGQAPLRGFGLHSYQDENGRLPRRDEKTVLDHIEEIRMMLRDEEGSFSLQGFQSAYSWQRFILRVVRWIRRRVDEISEELQRQPDVRDIRDFLTSRIEQPVHDPPEVVDNVSEWGSSPEPERRSVQENHRQIEQPEQLQLQHPAAAEKKKRRKSSKGAFRNSFAIERMTERLRSVVDSPERRCQTDFPNLLSQRSPKVVDATTSPRRQTMPAFPSQREPSEEREIPASPEPPDSNLFATVADSQWELGDEPVEKSLSPGVFRKVRREMHRDSQSPQQQSMSPDRNSHIPSTQDIWKAVTQPSQASPSMRHRAEPQRRSPAAFIDRQKDAYRVSPISEMPSTEKKRAPLPSHSRKRARPVSDDEDGDDDDEDMPFHRDRRTIDVARKRAQKPEQPQQKRQRLGQDHQSHNNAPEADDDDDEPASQLHSGLEESTRPAPRHHRRVTSATSSRGKPGRREPLEQRPLPPPPPPPPPSTAPAPAASGWLSSALHARSRRAWTAEEEERLLQLMEVFGSEWSRIKRHDELCPRSEGGPKLMERTQVNCKDKARNMLLGFLRNGEPIPRGFAQVTLKAKDREQYKTQLDAARRTWAREC